MSRVHVAAVMIIVASAVAAAPAFAADAETVAEEVRRLTADREAAVEVNGFRLKAGLATVDLTDGVLVPSTAVAGRPVEFAFIGKGKIELDPPDEVERGQLELFTGSTKLLETFDRAVFVIALDPAADALRAKAAADAPAEVEEAAALIAAWHESPERKLLDIEARIFADGLDDRLAAGFFCGYFQGLELDRFLYVVDPLGQEQVTLGQFVQPDLTRREEKKARRAIEKAQRRGKLIGLEVADLGIWDTWVSSSLRAGDGTSVLGSRGVEPDEYVIDATLQGKKLEIESTARVALRVLVEGLQIVSFEMNTDLIPRRVVDGAGRELMWFRSGAELVVALAEPAAVGDHLAIEITFHGAVIEKVASGAWVLRSTIDWYPHTGIVDRAKYEVTMHWPENLELLAPGAVQDRGRDGDDQRWCRWRLDKPSFAYSFEIGRYEKARGMAGEVAVEVAVDRLGQKAEDGLADEILETVIDAMDFYEEVYGPYPLERIQVVSAPRGFSQGMLGFVTLATLSVVDLDVWGVLMGMEDRRMVIAHELAHQWWGNVVGWRGYRDIWISEAMANYSALLYARRRLPESRAARTWQGPTGGWYSDLISANVDGRSLESLGPLAIGPRLDSSLTDDAYTAVVYKKGALVLNMLSRFYREDGFLGMLRELISMASFRVITTDDFLKVIGHLSGSDLSWFRDRYIDGTGLPTSYYSYSFEELPSGHWVVAGEARQQVPYEFRHAVIRTQSGILDVRRIPANRFDLANSVIVVPFQIGVTEPDDDGKDQRRLYNGQIVVNGESSPFRLELEREPEIFWLDRDSEVFGTFYNNNRWPRRNAFHKGREEVASGNIDAALKTFRGALSAPVAVIPEEWEDVFRSVDAEAEGRSINAQIHLAITRLHLDQGRLDDARNELARVEELIKGDAPRYLKDDLLVVESRILLLSGEARSAFRKLKKGVLGRGGFNLAETWALLAVAAHEAGEPEIFERATARAEDFGVDLGPLANGG